MELAEYESLKTKPNFKYDEIDPIGFCGGSKHSLRTAQPMYHKQRLWAILACAVLFVFFFRIRIKVTTYDDEGLIHPCL